MHDPSGDALLSKILIANRGEIAIRVMRTCRELGITTVAVYSELDRDAEHVRYADEAYALGGQTAAESYLNTDAILDAIRDVGRRRRASRATGSSPRTPTSRARSSTRASRGSVRRPRRSRSWATRSRRASPRSAPRSRRSRAPPSRSPTSQQILAFGAEHGYPIAIKAAFGGGGRGMKVVARRRRAPRRAFESAQREAQAYFGRSECYMERYLTRPRHVELQVFCDTHGNAVYLGDRDCSTQRRHQKLIEEAPAPAIPDATRRAMGEAAVKVARGVRLRERRHGRDALPGRRVLLPRDEHPPPGRALRHRGGHRASTSSPSRSASRRASRSRSRRTRSSGAGHAIECRINAEDPTKNFLPSPGTITKLRDPVGPGRALGRRLPRGRHDLAVLRQPHRQARRVGARPRPRDRPHASARSASSRSRAYAPRSPRTSRCSHTDEFRGGRALDEVGRGRGRPGAVRGDARRRRDAVAIPPRREAATASSSSGRCPSRSTVAGTR